MVRYSRPYARAPFPIGIDDATFGCVRSTRFWTVPNAISLSRFVLAVAFLLMPHPASRVVLILAAALTDFLDGFVARISHAKSQSGALIDPIADRTFVLAAVSAYLFDGLLTTGQYFIFISRDLATGTLRSASP